MTWRVPKVKYGNRWFNQQRFLTLYHEDPAGCWLWTGPVNNVGYGMFGFTLDEPVQGRRGNMMTAHRAAWMMQHDQEIPAGMNVNHECHTKNCVNPAHLKLGTQQEKIQNMLRDDIKFGGGTLGKRLGPRMRKDANRNYKYTEEEIQWFRDASIEQIQERTGLNAKRASGFRSRMRYAYRWLPWAGKRYDQRKQN
jgi:hypothetical protein